MKVLFFVSSMTLGLLTAPSVASEAISSMQASNHVGKVVTVCGKAVQIVNIKGDTFINLDKRHPHHNFVFYYYGYDFPISKFIRQEVCGTGLITIHKNKPNIVITKPSQITLK